MDAGIAAVCGALAGSVATIGAAFAAGWWQREGARIAVRAEYRRERRQPRHDAYKELISAASEIMELSKYSNPGQSEFDEPFEAAIVRLKETWLEIALLGPQNVVDLGSEVQRAALEMKRKARYMVLVGNRVAETPEEEGRNVVAFSERMGEYGTARDRLSASIPPFRKAALVALDEDGG
ncbi:hypothetical protein [Streptomyces sp. NPDC058308]|uniref:hypothetical protein n=1 Tax=Streptomyces sp. NPDC058308 TaxID=3346440 RepID=UPI0036EC7563